MLNDIHDHYITDNNNHGSKHWMTLPQIPIHYMSVISPCFVNNNNETLFTMWGTCL